MSNSSGAQTDQDAKLAAQNPCMNIKQYGTALTDSSTYYSLYQAYYHGMPREHQGIFVETHETGTGTGHLYHVIGTVLQGMNYNHRTEVRPEDSPEFARKQDLGYIKQAEYGKFQQICEAIEIPGKQLDLRGRRLDTTKPVRRCGDWVRDAIEALKNQEVLKAAME